MLPNSSCCYCVPGKAVKEIGLCFTRGYNDHGGYNTYDDSYDDEYHFRYPRNTSSMVSPNFPADWSDQWYLQFDLSYPTVCKLHSLTCTYNSAEAQFVLKFGTYPPVTVHWPPGSKTVDVYLPASYATLMQSGTLTVNVTLSISLKGEYAHLAPRPTPKPMEEEFKDLLESQLGSDGSIISTDGKLAAHWAVLAARSCFFSTMLKNEFKEARNNEIELDMTSETAGKMLKFIYTNKVDIEGVDEGQALLRAGDMYLIEGLKTAAEKFLSSKVTNENALELLILSHLHKAGSLKQKALDVLWKHPTYATENTHYSDLLKHPELVAELLVFRGSL